ncbi:conserved hypothetical protein [Candida dubliniensis CD36]|uniref:Uncharacterized protein n=1 Tax=Candida dubliniensis (strain CD36 / ATCC MYA-646 / CBS 7987 / NCPF 3949 / NRRL Y-17841) TaxID=573826 RepID=B9WM47_CANDC|nr:conserved hypothetical protein [Candida dubliniensis CD36]CAX40160.1 conserved hypothetical protein [Candida dubliniensis CD36]
MITRNILRLSARNWSCARPITTFIPYRRYFCTSQPQLLRGRNTIHQLNTQSAMFPIQRNNRLPLRTIVILIAASSSLTMLLFVAVQYKRFQDEILPDGKSRKRAIFLPLWFNGNILYQTAYSFPHGLKYFDPEFYEYIMTEINQSTTDGGTHNHRDTNDVEQFCRVLQEKNIKYAVLEGLSANREIRQIFGLPLTVDSHPNSDGEFEIWVESQYPSVSGLQIDITKTVDSSHTHSSKVDFRWVVKPINAVSVINNAMTSTGLGLDRLESTEANIKTHEQGSGKVHEVKMDKEKVNLNKQRDYTIQFRGKFMVSDKSMVRVGVVEYYGTIDFDHLLINRGVKITDMDMKHDGVLYKVM